MRNLKKNQQNLWYSIFAESIPVYETDENGEIRYTMINGEKKPIIVEERAGYTEPVLFCANISAARGEAEKDMFGISLDYTKSISTTDMELPIAEGSLIWQDTEPRCKADGTIDDLSADYKVVAIAKLLNSVVYAVKSLQKG